jgi:hypothetical protein
MQIDIFQSGLGFIEGPAWTRRGTLCLVSVSHGCVYELDGSGTVLRKVPTSGGPNGLACTGDVLFVAQNGGIFGASGVMQGGIQKVVDARSNCCCRRPRPPTPVSFLILAPVRHQSADGRALIGADRRPRLARGARYRRGGHRR